VNQDRLRGLGQSFSFFSSFNTIMPCALLALRSASGTFLCTRFWWQSMQVAPSVSIFLWAALADAPGGLVFLWHSRQVAVPILQRHACVVGHDRPALVEFLDRRVVILHLCEHGPRPVIHVRPQGQMEVA
jgi:hypothetical protein